MVFIIKLILRSIIYFIKYATWDVLKPLELYKQGPLNYPQTYRHWLIDISAI